MHSLKITAVELVDKLLKISFEEPVCILDSGGTNHHGSHLLIAGLRPIEVIEIRDNNAETILKRFDKDLGRSGTAAIFTLSYDFGLKLQNIKRTNKPTSFFEPDIFLAVYDCILIHDYRSETTRIAGNPKKAKEICKLIETASPLHPDESSSLRDLSSNFSEKDYFERIETVREYIRSGDTYQANITQQFTADLGDFLSSQTIFRRLRSAHPAPYSAFLTRNNDHVVSISPERFITVSDGKITASPIKGTRKRGTTSEEDQVLKTELQTSEKDRAENTMIVDLMRNDLGRICEFGSIAVEELCALEEHPSIFHLVSTISGELRKNTAYSDIIRAVFPCGSITGCPKIRTMEIIDELETANRGLSMGAIGYLSFERKLDLSVAIRTMVIRESSAVFNVGGGIVIDSDPAGEYAESLIKARALIRALKGR
ncbi:MAG: aminodeoxychorismate synthase component I [Pyrinomonadaceae bacterium]